MSELEQAAQNVLAEWNSPVWGQMRLAMERLEAALCKHAETVDDVDAEQLAGEPQ
jgi:hypothetical protein